jgi:hypothetical protein
VLGGAFRAGFGNRSKVERSRKEPWGGRLGGIALLCNGLAVCVVQGVAEAKVRRSNDSRIGKKVYAGFATCRACRTLAEPTPFHHLTRAFRRSPQGRRVGHPDIPCTPLQAARPAEEQPMTGATWISMIAITGFVWGGFLLVLLTAIRKESGKSGDE